MSATTITSTTSSWWQALAPRASPLASQSCWWAWRSEGKGLRSIAGFRRSGGAAGELTGGARRGGLSCGWWRLACGAGVRGRWMMTSSSGIWLLVGRDLVDWAAEDEKGTLEPCLWEWYTATDTGNSWAVSTCCYFSSAIHQVAFHFHWQESAMCSEPAGSSCLVIRAVYYSMCWKCWRCQLGQINQLFRLFLLCQIHLEEPEV